MDGGTNRCRDQMEQKMYVQHQGKSGQTHLHLQHDLHCVPESFDTEALGRQEVQNVRKELVSALAKSAPTEDRRKLENASQWLIESR